MKFLDDIYSYCLITLESKEIIFLIIIVLVILSILIKIKYRKMYKNKKKELDNLLNKEKNN